MRGAMENSIKLQSGHLQLRAKTYDESKTSLAFEDLIENPERLAEQVAVLAPVTAATPRLFASGIISSGDETMGVRIVGVDTSSEANAPFRDGLVSGEFLKADDREGIFIGQSLADKLHLKASDQVNLLVNTSNGDVDEQPFIIRGIYNTRTPGIDQFIVLMPIAKAQAIVRAPNHASTIFVILKERGQTDAVVAALQTSQYQVLTFESLNPLLVQMEEMTNAYMVLIYLIVLAITAAVIVNTLIMAVFERTREIGILSALGMKSGRIMAMFFAESSLLAVGGILIGLFLGGIMVALTSKYGFYIGDMGVSGILLGERIYAYLTLRDTISLTTTAFIITLLAALYPAMLAARMEPVDAMRGGKQA
jgi:ABC-type lipoprotein release transport system permease subunit